MFFISSFHSNCMIVVTMVMSVVLYLLVMFFISKSKGLFMRNMVSSEFLEGLWTILPCFVLASLAIPSLETLYVSEETKSPLLSVKVIGHQWYWSYEQMSEDCLESYDSYLIPSRGMDEDIRLLEVDKIVYLPVGSEVRMIISSSDVIHSWGVPSLGVKVDAIPGRLNVISYTPNKVGVFYGQCSEICGSLHSFMPIKVMVLSMEEFLGKAFN